MAELYQLVAAAVYHADGLWGEATFDLYLRELPEHYGYAICAGIDEAIADVLGMGFDKATVDYLRSLPEFSRVSDTFFESLRHMRFSGDIWAMPEGTPFFPREPVLRITAPLVQCVLAESSLIQRVGFGSAVATRACRIVQAAGDHEVLDFAARRWSCAESARAASRAAYIGGITNTSNVLAAGTHHIAPIGALSGGFVAIYRDERRALEAMRVHFPDGLQLALSEDDPRASVARYRAYRGTQASVRLGQPNLLRKARRCRQALDSHGLDEVTIMASGGLDEHAIAALVAAQAPIDRYAVGSALVRGVETLQSRFSYRVAEMTRGTSMEPVVGAGSSHYPGRKQVIRYPHKDVVGLEREASTLARVGGVAVLHHVLDRGERLGSPAPLVVARGLRAAGVEFLPPSVKRLREPIPHQVQPSAGVADLATR